MESILLVERLKQAIQGDFKDMKEELDKVKQEKRQLADTNDTLNEQNKELKDDNISLTKTLKELKEKCDHLQGKIKRKQDEIKKKDQWWDRYGFTAENMIKKLRTQGSFSPDVLHEVSRDLVDIMEEASSKESSSSRSSQESEVKNPSKLTTSKDRKKRVRYTEVSPESTGTMGRVQSKDLIAGSIHVGKFKNGDDESRTKKNNIDLAAYPKDVAEDVKNTGRKTGKELRKLIIGYKKHNTEDTSCLSSGTVGKDKENKWNILGSTKKGFEEDENYVDVDETCQNCPSLLTSTPMFSTSNKKSMLSGTSLHDISIIPKDRENIKNPSEIAGAEPNDVDSCSSLTPAVPTIFENLLTRRTSLTSNSSSTTKTKNTGENIIPKDENVGHLNKEKKQTYSGKKLKIPISDIQKLKSCDNDNGQSPSILRNLELKVEDNEDTIDYPVASEDNLGSPSILAGDLKPGIQNLTSKISLNGLKRKRGSFEEKEMGVPQDKEQEPTLLPDKKISRTNTAVMHFKIPIHPLHSTNTNKQLKEPDISPDPCSIVLLSDDEDEGNKMESSSVDMFANSGKSLSKDLSNDKDVIDVREAKDPSIKSAVPSTSQLSKNKDVIKEADIDIDLLDEQFPGFRKPDELNYKNIEVVRKKDDRAKLSGFSCRDCEQYYGEMTDTERKKKLKHCSRHRAKYSPPPSTPPGFWNLSFPSTQEVIEGGMMVTGDDVPVQKPRRQRKRRLLRSIPKKT